MKAHSGPLGKLDCLCSKKNSLELTSAGFLTYFRVGSILSLPLLLSLVLHALEEEAFVAFLLAKAKPTLNIVC